MTLVLMIVCGLGAAVALLVVAVTAAQVLAGWDDHGIPPARPPVQQQSLVRVLRRRPYDWQVDGS